MSSLSSISSLSDHEHDNEHDENKISQDEKISNTSTLEKQQLLCMVKRWIEIYNENEKMKLQMKINTEEKKELTLKLLNCMKSKNLVCLDTKNGSLAYQCRKQRKQLNIKKLQSSLEQYFMEHELVEYIQNLNISDLSQYIFDNRDIVNRENIFIRKK